MELHPNNGTHDLSFSYALGTTIALFSDSEHLLSASLYLLTWEALTDDNIACL